MSAALINRSLTNVRTELEFLRDSEVIDQSLFDTLMASLPRRYAEGMTPWGVENISRRSGGSTTRENNDKLAVEDVLSKSFQKTSLREPISMPPNSIPAAIPPQNTAPLVPHGYCKASYNYESNETGDLNLTQGDRLVVLERLSSDWWKGYKKGETFRDSGVFPSNYVTVISETEFQASAITEARFPSPPEKSSNSSEKASYSKYDPPKSAPPIYHQDTSSQDAIYQHGYSADHQQQQPSYGGYSQYPPPPTNYYAPSQMAPQQYPQEQQMVQQGTMGSTGADQFKKFGSKLGNAAIFGAGATIGSDIVNSIF